MLKNYLKIAVRTLRRHKGYTFINVAGLAVGLAACLLIALYVQHEWSYDRFHEKADRIYQVLTVFEYDDEDILAQAAIPLASALDAAFPEIQRVVQFKDQTGVVQHGNASFEEDLLFASDGFFDVFSFDLIQGQPARVLADPNGVVLSEQVARKYFGDEAALGKRLSIRLRETFYDLTVTGIVEDTPTASSIQYGVILPFSKLQDFDRTLQNPSWGTLSPLVYIEVPTGAQAADLEAKFPAFVARSVPEENNASSTRLRLLPLTDTHLTPEVYGQLEPSSNPAYAYILSGLALLILLTACINFTTLAVSRSARRAREVGVRKAVGAHQGQLIGQFWTEAALLTAAAALLGLLLARLALPMFSYLADRTLTFGAWSHGSGWIVLIGLLLLTSLLAGGYPALYLSRFEPTQVLQGTPRVRGKRRLTQGLVVGQFALSIFLIAGTLLMWQQLRLVQTKDLGFEKEQVVRIETQMQSQQGEQVLARFRNDLAGRSDVMSLTGSWQRFGDENPLPNAFLTTSDAVEIKAHAFRAEYDVIETLGLTLTQGRSFSRARAADTEGLSVLVNESLVRAFGWDDPIGKKLSVRFTVEEATVVGVTQDFHFQSLHHEVEPLVIHMSPTAPISFLYARIAPGRLSEGLSALEGTWQRAAPELPFRFVFLDEAVEQQYQSETRWTRIITGAALLALMIACLGLFGLAAFAAERRRKEIGIRKVLGASVASIVGLLSKDFLKLVLVAFVLAAPLAYVAMRRWLQDFAYRVDLGPSVFLLAGAAALLIALLTVSYQAVRAATANPTEALRSE